MKKFNYQFYGSHVGRMNYGGAKFCRFALFPLMLFMLLLVPTSMVAETDYDESVTFDVLAGNPEGFSGETYANLFDGENSKWCCRFNNSAYVIFKASKAGIPVGYTITTGNDNENENGRNPWSWKLYGNNEGEDGEWELIQEVSDDEVLKDKNNTPYNFKCECSTSYQYFKWEISAIHSGGILQVGEFELKLQTCSHKKANGSSALGEVINTVETTCAEQGYTTQKCSLCNSIVKVYLNDKLKPHTLTHHALKAATCTEAGIIEYWQCSVCNKLFSNEAATTEIADAASLEIPAKGHQYNSEGICTVCSHETVKFTELAGDPVGNSGETYANLFDGKKEDGNFSKWCGKFDSPKGAYVIFEANKAGIPVGYTITTGDDNANWGCSGRNPLSWKLYGNNEGKDGAWTLIDKVENDKVLQDKNYTSYDFTCEGSTSYKYFKWEISAIHSGSTLQVGEFELKLKTCSHKDAGGSSALGEIINTVETTCAEHGYTTHKCSICNSIVKVYKDDVLKPHTLTHHELKPATCTETGIREYWQCSVCNKLFSDADATTEITDATSLEIPANGHKFDSEGNCTGCQYKDSRYALFNNLDGITDVVITDNGSYPWQMLDLKAKGMEDLGFTIPVDSKGLMSSNYKVNNSSSETVIRFNVSKPLLLTSQVLVSSQKTWDKFNIYVDNKLDLRISGEKQTECKVLLSVGEHSLKLSYQKDNGIYENADRAFLYNLKTSTTIDDYVADYESSNNTLTFKRITSDNLEDLDFHSIVVLRKAQTVSDMCSLLGIDTWRIKNIVFEENFKTYAPTSLNSFFQYLNELEIISGLDYLNTANVTNMSDMFYKCNKLSSLDLSNFNTANVTNMYEMFCDCNKLSSLDLSNFNTAKVTNMGNMFENCNKLTSLDLTSFNTAKVEYMWKMFYNCSALTTIYASDKFVTDKVTDGRLMFSGCTNLKGYDSSKTDYTYANYSTDGYFSRPAYAEFDESIGTLTFKCDTSIPEGTYMLNVGKSYPKWYAQRENIKKVVFDTSLASTRATNCYAWFSGCKNLTDIEGIENLNTENVTNMNSMFDRCSALTSLDLTNFNTAKVSDMSYMFMGCTALTTIFVSDKFVTDLVTSSDNMFHMCINLIGAIEYDGSKSDHTYANYETGYFTPEGGFHAYAEFDGTGTLTFRRGVSKPEEAYDLNEGANAPAWSDQSTNINKVVFDASFVNARPTSCYKWFDMCTSLTEIEGIENLNTEKVTNMGFMFDGCTNLAQIEGIENLNTEEVTNMGFMFWGCNNLTTLDVSNFDTQKVEDMRNMFAACTNLESLNVSNFNTQKVKYMSQMFHHCNSLTSLDVSNFDTQNVENMSYMFSWCTGLNSLDLSNFDTKEVTNMSSMFWNSSALKTIYVSDKFVTTNVSSGADMFKDCTSLKGAIPEYDKSKIDHTYANYTTGYFSKLVGKNGDEKIGAAGETLATDNLVLADGKDFVAYEPFVAKEASYSRKIKEGTTWGTLCLPFAIDQSQETECKFYRLTGIDNDNNCITLESFEEGKIPAGTPVLFKMNENEQTLSISVQNVGIVIEPVAGTDSDVNLVGSFTKIGGKDNQGLDDNDYIIGKDKFWLVSDLDGGNGVGIKPMRAYIHPANEYQARAAMLSIGKGDGTTAIDNLNAISNDANAEYYDANGRRTNGLQKGLNIVKRGSKTYKIMVK